MQKLMAQSHADLQANKKKDEGNGLHTDRILCRNFEQREDRVLNLSRSTRGISHMTSCIVHVHPGVCLAFETIVTIHSQS